MQKPKWKAQAATKKDIREIDQRLGDCNQVMLSFSGVSEKPVAYVIKINGEIIAGISACIDWGHILHVELLFVEDSFRHQGIGKFLLGKVEHDAREFGASLAQTDTFDFQAKDFYLKNGYEIFSVLDDSPRPGHKRYYLKKALN